MKTSEFQYLGQLVQRYRELSGLNQDQLSVKLNKQKNRPVDPYRKKEKKFHRSWIAKLESGTLSRELRNEIRLLLAEVLKGDKDLYLNLPTGKEKLDIQSGYNVLPLIKIIAKSKLKKNEFQAVC